MNYQNDAEESSKDVKFVLVLSTAVLIFLSIILMCFAGEKYQTYRKAVCEWCGTEGSILNPLQQAHFYNQSRHPLWKNVKMNSKTLHRRCHLVMHKGNWTNEVPEWCVLFGITTNQIIEACVKETGSIDGKGKDNGKIF